MVQIRRRSRPPELVESELLFGLDGLRLAVLLQVDCRQTEGAGGRQAESSKTHCSGSWQSGGAPSRFRRRTMIASVSTGMITSVKTQVTSSAPVDKLPVISRVNSLDSAECQNTLEAEKFNAQSVRRLVVRQVLILG